MSRRFFGTDGVRGIANQTLTPEMAFSIGQAAGRWLTASNGPRRAVIGRDTRRSGTMLGASVAAGLNSAGVDVDTLGVVPTPTVSFLARTEGYGLGFVISASHNPAPDNGIKLFGSNGGKLSDEVELSLEALMGESWTERPTGGDIGCITARSEGVAHYLDFLVSLVPEGLAGWKIAVDGANGAAYHLGPEALRRLGAEVVTTAVEPDGVNINAGCGATHPQSIQHFTVENRADIGVAFDGDADRAVFSDGRGRLINGDRTLGIWSAAWREDERHGPPIVVGTVMSNGGFERYLEGVGVKLERASVGDKYVSERLRATGSRVGGEQSGHIIFPEHGPTGDGIVTALELFRAIRKLGAGPADLVDAYEPWPQLLVNVTVASRETWNQGPKVVEAMERAKSTLGASGRLVIRASGTQPMVRVMVEADSYELRDSVAEEILRAMESEVDGRIYSKVDLTHALGD